MHEDANGLCKYHMEQMSKTTKNCSDISVLIQRANDFDDRLKHIYDSIFGNGGSNTIKSRLQKAEDGVKGLTEAVLENREVYKEGIETMSLSMEKSMETMGKSLIKFIVIIITISTVVIGGMFSFLFGELKDVRTQQAQVHQIHPAVTPTIPGGMK